jgi:hypothetical protein
MSNKVQAKGVAERTKQNVPRNDELTNMEVLQSHANDDQLQPTEGDTGCDESDHKRRKMIEGRTAIRSPQSALMSWMKPQGVSTRRTG